MRPGVGGRMNASRSRRNVDVTAAAEEVGVSPFTIRAWVRQGKLGHLKAGRRVLIPLVELEKFISKNTVRARD
jgi:excisionase family DNA binding protein